MSKSLTLLILVILAAGCASTYPTQTTLVTKVIDGDTVVVEGGQRVRLLNIDSRERGEECYGEAKRRLEELVLLKNVTLERDKENQDRYDRLLRHIYVGNMSANLQMVNDGLAIAYVIEPNVRHRDAFIEAEREARQQGGCVWTKLP